jgi:hypothetical protein
MNMRHPISTDTALIGGAIVALMIGAFALGYWIDLGPDGREDVLGASVESGEVSEGLKDLGREAEMTSGGTGS